MKVSCKFCILGLIFLILSSFLGYALTNDDLIDLKKESFKNKDTIGIKEINHKDKTYYLIQVNLFNLFNDPKKKIQKKLALLNKGILIKYIQKNHNKGRLIKEIVLRNWYNLNYFEENNRSYLLSYINENDVLLKFQENETPNNEGPKGSKSSSNRKDMIIPGDFDNSAQNEITSIKEFLKRNPTSIEGYQDLYQYYKLQNDIDNMSATIDKIMELKFLKSE